MRTVLAQWRASYVPGEWIALSGPTSLVVLLPSSSGWTPLLDRIWRAVLEATSLVELAGRLSEHGLDAMPSFGAFFWTPEGMRSLVRGAVVVRDASTGTVVADGQGIQTWSEIGLGDVDCIRIDTGGGSVRGLQLPLVVGAALASSLTLDARVDVSVPEVSVPEGSSAPPEALEQRSNPDEVSTEPWSDAERAAMENGDTELMLPTLDPTPDVSPPTQAPPPPVPRLVLSDGTEVDLRQPVRIGRAPNANGAAPDVVLVTVRSPQQDISRTHLEVALSAGQVVVTDLHSTNGSTVSRPGAAVPQRLAAGIGVPVPLGSLLDIGDGVTARIAPSSPQQDDQV